MGEDVPVPPSGPPGSLAAGTKFAGRYTIIECLGRGGVGTVYKASDDELGTVVALKTISFHAGTDPGARGDMERRFNREARLALGITHANVARIHEIGDADGVQYVTMALIEGETLSTMIERLGPLPVPDAVGIARQIAGGLAAAHASGVIHRNLKPENVMVAGSRVFIMDCGLARSNATQSGFGGIADAVEYMAPEQSQGSGVDERADIYACGLILYDMLTGRKRLHGHESAMAELLFRMRNTPPGLRKLIPEIPVALDTLVAKATHPNPDRRFAKAEQLVSALESLAADGDESTRGGRRAWWTKWW